MGRGLRPRSVSRIDMPGLRMTRTSSGTWRWSRPDIRKLVANLGWILDAGDDLVTESAPDVEGRLYGFGEERFLGFEVVVEAAEADVGGVGDLLNAAF